VPSRRFLVVYIFYAPFYAAWNQHSCGWSEHGGLRILTLLRCGSRYVLAVQFPIAAHVPHLFHELQSLRSALSGQFGWRVPEPILRPLKRSKDAGRSSVSDDGVCRNLLRFVQHEANARSTFQSQTTVFPEIVLGRSKCDLDKRPPLRSLGFLRLNHVCSRGSLLPVCRSARDAGHTHVFPRVRRPPPVGGHDHDR